MSAAVLDRSATASSEMSAELREFTGKAVGESATAASSMNGWSLAGELVQIGDSWQKAFQLVHGYLDGNARNLHSVADSYRAAETGVTRSMQQTAAPLGAGR
ncbi:hypothetical protein A6A07_33250 [Streptomyces sp. CB03911]|nr:hypothetical protein A6A07_33250 [Streptomyces sp. CB03911]